VHASEEAMKKIVFTTLFLLGVWLASADDFSDATGSQVTPADPALRKELLQRMDSDQRVRKAAMSWCKQHNTTIDVDKNRLSAKENSEYENLFAAVPKIDEENTRWLKQIVEQRGWPTISMVGSDGASAAWLLVQHADADIKFQRKCLDLMAALPKNELSQTHFAYLTDRVLLAEGKKQIYGTQFDWIEGKFQPLPLEDEANVDKLRADAGLPPLAEYAKEMRELYIGDSKK
jgi:hypothetical protein